MKISVVIPSRPDDPHLQRCLDAVCLALPEGGEVIVAGDGWAPQPIQPTGNGVVLRVLALEKAGPAACRDAGARLATHDWLCFVDSDVLVHRDAIVRSISILRACNDDGLVGSYDDEPEDPGTISRFRNLLHHYHHRRNAGMTGVFWGAFSLLRKSAYLEVGGFDPTYRDASIEDIELGYRLAAKGYRIALRPAIQVTHLKRWTFQGMVRTDILLRAKPWTILLHRYRNRHMGDLNTSPKERLSAMLTGAALLSLALSLTGFLPFQMPAMIYFLLIILQYGFYAFIMKRMQVWTWPAVFVLHQVYFLSAMAGWVLARVEILYRHR